MIRLTDILGSEVVDDDGRRLGHAADVRIERGAGDDEDPGRAEWRLKGIVVGRRGLLERFGAARPEADEPILPHDLVPWERVLRIEDGRIVVRP
ncbi:MAG: PRC-barrel domain-containing protein [Thermoleophilaceae bacterium]|jgi:PRC-barrel domain